MEDQADEGARQMLLLQKRASDQEMEARQARQQVESLLLQLDGPRIESELQKREQQQLRMAQKMVECCSQLQCSYCHCSVSSSSFYAHLLDQHAKQINSVISPTSHAQSIRPLLSQSSKQD